MRRVVALLLGLVFIGGLVQAEELYAFYYSRSPGRDMEVNLLNPSANPVQYTIRAYDAWGRQVWEAAGDLAPKDAGFYLLSDQVAEDAANWGVITVVSTERLVIALDYYVNGEPAAFDLITRAVPDSQTGSTYQLVLYHTEVTELGTALILTNPWDQEVSGQLVIYKSDGSRLGVTDLTFSPYEAKFVNLGQLVGQGSRNWGVLEVVTQDRSIVAACVRVMGGAMQVENVAEAWTVEAAQPVVTPPGPETPPKKED